MIYYEVEDGKHSVFTSKPYAWQSTNTKPNRHGHAYNGKQKRFDFASSFAYLFCRNIISKRLQSEQLVFKSQPTSSFYSSNNINGDRFDLRTDLSVSRRLIYLMIPVKRETFFLFLVQRKINLRVHMALWEQCR